VCRDRDGYVRSLASVERYFRGTGTPALIAECERLAISIRPREPSVAPSEDTTRL
jgi:hypothetical protein